MLTVPSFKWIPLALAFSFTGKEKKADPWTPLYAQLGPLDIKVFKEYEPGYTTHVVASKRNTPKGLQALIDGKYIVENTYVTAIVEAADTFQEDFCTFPNASKFLPPKGKEPTERPATAYSPDPTRQDMFDGYTFIFYSQQQFDTLLPPIAGGRGKALYREVIPDRTTVEEFVEYVKQVAGEKGLGELEDGGEGKGVVVVKFNPTGGQGNEWYANFSIQVALSLGLRLIEQNEFLDAILGSDSSVLRRPLEVASTSQRTGQYQSNIMNYLLTMSVAPTTQAANRSMVVPDSAPAEIAPSQPPRRGRGRRAVAKFTGFEDDFNAPVNMSSIPEAEPVAPAPEPAPEPIEESQSLFVTQQEPDMNKWREPSEEPPPVIQPRTTRKRQATPIDEEERQERLAPSFAKLKKRRLEEAEARRERGESTPVPAKPVEPPKEPTPPPPEIEKNKPARRTKKSGDTQVEEAMHKRMEEQEKAARIERDAQLTIMADINIDEVRSGIEILEMSVGRTRTVTRPGDRADESDRWDDKWNGRRDFKKFRRQGAPVNRDHNKVIISLEEVKNKEFGIGDEYWVDNRREEERESQRKSQNRSQNRKAKQQTEPVEDSDSETLIRNVRRSKQRSAPAPEAKAKAKTKTPEPEPVFIVSSEEENDDELIEHPELEPPRPVAPPKANPRSQRASRARSESQTLETENPEPRTARKRTAEPMAKPAPAKKAKQTTIDRPTAGRRRAAAEESDDDMRFGFGRRKR